MLQGLNKREAKRNAAEKVLEKLKSSENFPDVVPVSVPSDKDRRKRNNVVKGTKARPEYGKNINPICRLYHLQQARNQPDPSFEEVRLVFHMKHRNCAIFYL